VTDAKRILRGLTLLAFASVASAQARSGRPIDRSGLAELRARSSPALESMRGGAVREVRGVDPSERASLQKAQTVASDLAAMRAGEITFSDRDLKIIAITAAVILLVVLIT
jgi:hypothetical protein